MQRLLQVVQGEQAPLFYYVNGEVSRDEMMRLRERGITAVGIVRDPILLNDVQAMVPAWGFFFHDIFHAHSMAPYSPTLRHFGAALYRYVTQGGLPVSDWREEHLRKVVDFEPRPNLYLSYTLEHLHDIRWLPDLNWRRKFQDLDTRMRFVQDYRRALKDFVTVGSEHAAFKSQLEEELSQVARKLERVRKISSILNFLGAKTDNPPPY